MNQSFQQRRRGNLSATAAIFLVVLLVLPALAIIRLAHLFDFRFIVGYLAVVSALTPFLYWRDKRSAEAGAWRTPESTLHFAELFGGWPAAFIVQRAFRHKISKRSYQVAFWSIVTLHQAVCFDMLNEWHYSRSALLLLHG